jgi:tetratricopeptide (TPR) repeat protein
LKAALAQFDEAIRLSPELAEIYFNRATLYEQLHLSEKALADFDQAIRSDPGFANAYKRRAAIYSGEGRADEARRDLAKARELEQAAIGAREASGTGTP